MTFRVLGPTPTPTPTADDRANDEGPSSPTARRPVARGAGARHRTALSGPQRGRLPFTGDDIRSTALAGLAAVLAGTVALCLAWVRRRRRA